MARTHVQVRPARPGDVADLTALVRSSDTASGAFSGKSLVDPGTEALHARLGEILADGERILLVATTEQAPADVTADMSADDATDDVSRPARCDLVGLLAARFDDVGIIERTPVLHTTHLLVSARCRRRGVGRALLTAAVQLAEENGADRMLATAGASSREANRYLARIGFAPLVVHRIATTATLRRSLGMTDTAGRLAVLRRARLVRAQRTGYSVLGGRA